MGYGSSWHPNSLLAGAAQQRRDCAPHYYGLVVNIGATTSILIPLFFRSSVNLNFTKYFQYFNFTKFTKYFQCYFCIVFWLFFVRHFATSFKIRNFMRHLNFFQNAAKRPGSTGGTNTDHHSIGKSAKIKKNSEVLSALGGYVFFKDLLQLPKIKIKCNEMCRFIWKVINECCNSR